MPNSIVPEMDVGAHAAEVRRPEDEGIACAAAELRFATFLLSLLVASANLFPPHSCDETLCPGKGVKSIAGFFGSHPRPKIAFLSQGRPG